MERQARVIGVILCGGRGSRMGGVNKGLVGYKHRRLYEFAHDNLKNITDRILINSNTEIDTYKSLGFEVLDDGKYPYQGPLAGIYAGLILAQAEQTEYVAFAPCDQGTLPALVYSQLLEQAQKAGAAFATSGSDCHPTCSVIAIRLASALKQSLDANQLKLGQWMQNHAAAVDFSGIDFANINQLPH